MANKLFVRIFGDKTHLDKTLKGADSSLDKFKKSVLNVGKVIAGAFVVKQIINFGKELLALGGKAEGIRIAFNNLNDPNLLNELRAATRGTVSDIQLMQKAVQAKNFQIPIEQLAALFEFASARAVQTGESVEYLTNSIVTGIGRKAPLILDNLGISAVRLREELKGVGADTATVGDIAAAVGRIATAEMKTMGGFIETAGTRMQALNANWENMKERIAGVLVESGALKKLLGKLETAFESLFEVLFPEEAQKSIYQAKKLNELYEEREEALKRIANIEAYQNNIGKTEPLQKGLFKKLKSKQYSKKVDRNVLGNLEEQLETLKLINEELERRANIENRPVPKQRRETEKGTPLAVPDSLGFPISSLDNLAKTLPTMPFKESTRDIYEWIDAMDRAGVEVPADIRKMANSMAEWEGVMKSGVDAISAFTVSITEDLFTAIGSGDYKSLGDNVLNSLADFIGNLGKLMVAYGTALLAFAVSSKSPDPISAGLAITAGLAAIGIAALIRGSLSRGTDDGGGSSAVRGGGGSQALGLSTDALSIQVEGVLRGEDIVIASRRYQSKLNTTT